MEQEIEKLRNEFEGANNKIDDQQNIISQQAAGLLEMSE